MGFKEAVKKMSGRLSRHVLTLLFVALVAVGLWYMVKHADMEKLRGVWQNINLWGVLAVGVITITNICFMILRWYLLLKPIRSNISLRSVYRISLNAIGANFAVPGKVGVPAKALLLKQTEQINISDSIPSLFSELLLEYVFIGIFLLASTFIGGYFRILLEVFQGNGLRNGLLIGLVLILLLMIFWKKIKGHHYIKTIHDAAVLTFKRADIFLGASFITVVNLFLTFGADWLLFKSMGYTIPYYFIIFSSALSNIAGLLSPLPGGIGVREISGAYLFQHFYQLGEIAVLMIFIRRVLTYFALLILFISERITHGASLNKKSESI